MFAWYLEFVVAGPMHAVYKVKAAASCCGCMAVLHDALIDTVAPVPHSLYRIFAATAPAAASTDSMNMTHAAAGAAGAAAAGAAAAAAGSSPHHKHIMPAEHKFSQPRSEGPHVAVKQMLWSFDGAHPALAGQHYMRTADQNR